MKLQEILELLLESLFGRNGDGGAVPVDRIDDIDHIKKWEQLRLKAYLPTPNDKWTIGWGHTSTAKAGMVITEEQAEAFLRKDLVWVEATIRDLVKVPLTQKQFDSVGSLATSSRSSHVSRAHGKMSAGKKSSVEPFRPRRPGMAIHLSSKTC